MRVCPYFSLLRICFCLFARFLSCLLSFVFFALVVFLCPLALSLWLFGCWWCCFFPFGLHAKRKGAPCWCVLSSCVVSVQILVTLSKNSVAVALAFSLSVVAPLSDYLDISTRNEILHSCDIVNWYIVSIPSITGIIEANK